MLSYKDYNQTSTSHYNIINAPNANRWMVLRISAMYIKRYIHDTMIATKMIMMIMRQNGTAGRGLTKCR